MFFREYFNARARERDARKAHNRLVHEVKAAIGNKDVPAIGRLMENLDSSNPVYADLLMEAVKTDDVDVFKAVFSKNPDPNFSLSTGYTMLFCYYNYDAPLLPWSIRQGARNVALFLARHPDLNMEAKEECDYLRLPFGEDEAAPSSIELASRTPGMEEVVIALANRKLQTRVNTPKP